MSKGPWYKVLMEGKSFHGGNLTWSLPEGKSPGEWHEVDGDLGVFVSGIHVTNDPARWFKLGAKVFLAECEGFAGAQQDKACFRRVRLVRELDKEELRVLRIAGDGRLTVTGNALAFAFGSCEVEAWGSSRVEAWGSSRVVARESSRVVAWGSSSVEAWGSSSVEAWESSSVNIFGPKCTVTESGEAVVIDRTCHPPKVRYGWEVNQ